MKKLTKILALTATGLILTGVSYYQIPMMNNIAQAKPLPRAERVSPQVRIDNEIQNISECFAIDKQVLASYYNEGWEMPQIRQGAFLAYASHKSFEEIMNLKEKNSWPRVEYLLGLTPNDMKAAHDDIVSTQIANKLDMNKSIVTFLVEQNYGVDEIVHGLLYSMYVDKSPADIIEMHNPPTKNWEMVANDLGITQEQLDEIHQKMEALDLGMIKGPKGLKGHGPMRF